ncbi:MAG: 8-oxo-dGTP diphosphatase [Paenibacillaceae bacterium]|nr:8-oxo-dGTP diphosphatase [Paenibacillaceae bacterium]
MARTELTNMCMICDETTGKVLAQRRVKSWKGVAFPGGKVEDGESIVDSTVREVKEETGLTVAALELCGIVHWHNGGTGDKYIVFCYRTSVFSGELLEQTDEGELFWTDRDELASLPLAEGFGQRLPMFFDRAHSEGFGIWNVEGGNTMKWQ